MSETDNRTLLNEVLEAAYELGTFTTRDIADHTGQDIEKCDKRIWVLVKNGALADAGSIDSVSPEGGKMKSRRVRQWRVARPNEVLPVVTSGRMYAYRQKIAEQGALIRELEDSIKRIAKVVVDPMVGPSVKDRAEDTLANLQARLVDERQMLANVERRGVNG